MPDVMYHDDGKRTDVGFARNAPELPLEVLETCARKEIVPSTLTYDFLCKFWYPMDGWKGMFLGIEPDGHAHT